MRLDLATPRIPPPAPVARPILTVAAICERDGRFLLVEEWAHGRRVLNQPAGRVEAGETLLAAVVREVLEEARCDFAPEAVTGVYQWQRPGDYHPYLRVAFCGSCSSERRDRGFDRGILRTLWLTRAELAAQPAALRSPMVLTAVDDYLRGQRRACATLDDLGTTALAALACPV
jgi:8-oxo-dGTP pyrophosphatase MutT (NUDIX family)